MAKTSREIRQANYRFLFDQFKKETLQRYPDQPERGMLKLFGERIGVSAKFLSHINTDFKPMGSRTARKIEESLKLEVGWMDMDHISGPPSSSKEKQFIKAALDLFRTAPVEAQELMIEAFRQRVLGEAGK